MPTIVRTMFEDYVKDVFNLEDCIAVCNGTCALMAVFFSLDLEPGDEVIVTPFTFIATTNAIILAGAKPVFVDINPDTLLLDETKIEEAITERTKAILPVHLFGRVCNMAEIMRIAKKYNLAVIEDTAQAFGAVDESGRDAGMIGDVGTFSFYKTKNISTFEGGMICVPKHSILQAERIRSVCDQGQDGKYNHVSFGFNFRLAEPLCLLAYEKIKLHMEGVRAELGLRGPEAGHYPRVVYDQPIYKQLGIKGDCPIAERIAQEIREGIYQYETC